MSSGYWGNWSIGKWTEYFAFRDSSASVQDLFVLSGLTDTDYTGEIKVMVWAPMHPCEVQAHAYIAQLIYFWAQLVLASHVDRGTTEFGSTEAPQILWTQKV